MVIISVFRDPTPPIHISPVRTAHFGEDDEDEDIDNDDAESQQNTNSIG